MLVLVCLVLSLALVNGNCSANGGTLPAAGACDGPTERAVVKLSNAESFNGNCPANQVQYFKDGDPNASMCGECVPGSSGVEDPEWFCGINQFCNDNATCQATKTSPLYNEPCPYEQGGASYLGWCGPGLRCIHHVCLPCENGVYDPTDGKYCIDNEWTYSKWSRATDDPEVVLLSIIIALMIIWMTVPNLIRKDEDGHHYILGWRKYQKLCKRG